MSCASAWMKIFNWLLFLQGLLIVAFGIYIASVNFGSFVYVLCGVGLYITIVGFIGIRMSNGKSEGCVTFYSVTFFALILLHAAMVFGFLFYEDKTIQVLQDLNSSGDNGKIQDYLDNHRDDFKYAGIAVLSIELFTFCMSVCCSRSVSGALDDHMYAELDDRKVGLVSSEANYVSATPQTDARRAQLSQKYGGLFEKPQNPYGVV